MTGDTREILVVDVFTNRPYAGNPAAVMPVADGLADWQMQSIAREMNHSETAFVSASSRATARVRFFTPTTEIPLAGHPTLATWHAMVEIGRVRLTGESTTITQELNVGVLPVELRSENGALQRIVMTQKPPEFLKPVSAGPIATALGLSADRLDPRVRPTVVSTGTPQLMVLLRSGADVQRLTPDMNRLAELSRADEYYGVHVFALGGITPAGQAQARHFAPAIGINEDPVTGSASGGMAAYLVENGFLDSDAFVIEQGHIIGRPGEVYAEVDRGDGHVRGVRVGGSAVTVLRGSIQVPSGV